MTQFLILFFSGSSIFFLSRKDHWQKWGFVLGLCGQPFWIWSAYHSGQWGIFFVSLWFTYRHIVGIANHFSRRT